MRSDEFMNAEDVARYLHLGKNTVYQLAKSGKLASYHVGRKLKFTLEDVEAYVASTHHAPQAGMQASANAGFVAQDPKRGLTAGQAHSSISDAASFGNLTGDPFVIAGGEEVADMLASMLASQGTPAQRLARGSYTALVNLYAGDADAAVVHLYDQASNSCNVPYVRNLAPGASAVVFRLFARDQGFIVERGNPKNLNTWGSLLRENVRLSNREKGSGARVLLDEKLRAMEARTELIDGYDSYHQMGHAAIRRVASGIADVAVGTLREAQIVGGVQFVPMHREWVDLVVSKTPKTRPVVRQLKTMLSKDRLRHDVETAFAPCDVSKFGAVVYES